VILSCLNSQLTLTKILTRVSLIFELAKFVALTPLFKTPCVKKNLTQNVTLTASFRVCSNVLNVGPSILPLHYFPYLLLRHKFFKQSLNTVAIVQDSLLLTAVRGIDGKRRFFVRSGVLKSGTGCCHLCGVRLVDLLYSGELLGSARLSDRFHHNLRLLGPCRRSSWT